MKFPMFSLCILVIAVCILSSFQENAIRKNTRINEAQTRVLDAQEEVMKSQTNLILHLVDKVGLGSPTTKPADKIEFTKG